MKSYEMVETLSTKTGVSLEIAKQALEMANWDILDAAIYAERLKAQSGALTQNSVSTNNAAYFVSGQQKEVNGSFATPGNNNSANFNPAADFKKPYGGTSPAAGYVPPYKDFPNHGGTVNGNPYEQTNSYVPPYKNFPNQEPMRSEPVGEFVGKLAGLLENAVNHVFLSYFTVTRHGKVIFRFHLMLFLILSLVFWWAAIPLIVLGFAFECKYSLSIKQAGEKTFSDIIDSTVNSALNTADAAKNTILNETQNVRSAYEQSKKTFEEDFRKGKESVRVDLTKKNY